MSKPFYEMSDPNLSLWANNASQRLTASFAAFHITQEQAAALAAATAGFDSALSAWREPITRTPIASANKKEARETLLAIAKYLVASINNNPATTDAQRDELGIKARKRPQPRPAPDVSPLIDVEKVDGRIVKIRLHAEGRRGRPANVQGASLFTFIGAVAPTDPAEWKFEGLTTKTNFELTFPASASASTVWVCANWYNERGETGAACAPISINLPASPVVPQAESMKVAA